LLTYTRHYFSLLTTRTPPSPLFPYTTLFRSLRRAGLHCRNFLRLDVAPNGLHLCLRDCPRGGGHDVALPVPHSVTQGRAVATVGDRKSTRLNSSHLGISYAVFCLKKKNSALL